MIEDDELRLAFYDTDDWACELIVTPASGSPFDIVGIFDAKPVDSRPVENRFTYQDGARPSGSSPSLRCRDVDLPKALAGRGTIAITSPATHPFHGKVYNLFKIEHDGRGDAFAELRLVA